MAAFGPRVSRRTAFRKLKDLHAHTSYSHRGGYYELADFDQHGLASTGPLLPRYRRQPRRGRTLRARRRHPGRPAQTRRRRAAAAQARRPLPLLRDQRAPDASTPRPTAADGHARTRAVRRPDARAARRHRVVRQLLDERQRRLFAGLESLKCGWGGDRRIATLLASTRPRSPPAAGSSSSAMSRLRRAGGGRTPTEKKRPKSSPASKP